MNVFWLNVWDFLLSNCLSINVIQYYFFAYIMYTLYLIVVVQQIIYGNIHFNFNFSCKHTLKTVEFIIYAVARSPGGRRIHKQLQWKFGREVFVYFTVARTGPPWLQPLSYTIFGKRNQVLILYWFISENKICSSITDCCLPLFCYESFLLSDLSLSRVYYLWNGVESLRYLKIWNYNFIGTIGTRHRIVGNIYFCLLWSKNLKIIFW